MNNPEEIEFFWQNFLATTNRNKDTLYLECFHFDLSERVANELLDLVLKGIKKATASSLLSYQISSERIPQIGDLSIITDWNGNPKCVIETTAVTIIPFKEITYDICKREGEDKDLQSWQEGHVAFFTTDGKNKGYEFSWDMPVVFEDFEVVYIS